MAPSLHAWREFFNSDDRYGRVEQIYDFGYITEAQRDQAIYEIDHAGHILSRREAELED